MSCEVEDIEPIEAAVVIDVTDISA